MTQLLSTKQVADFLGVNEKKVYSLIQDKGLPCSKVTGKWMFPKHLVEQWIENHTINYPERKDYLSKTPSLFVVAGSNDILLDRTLNLFMRKYPEYTAVFGNLGSKGGLKALRQGLCHIATSHLIQEDFNDFNFEHAAALQFSQMPAVVNFCYREQGLILSKSIADKVKAFQDIVQGFQFVNRSLTTGTRLWFDRALEENKINPDNLPGYEHEVQSHLELGLEISRGNADIGPGIKTVADLLGLDFLSMHWERFDLLINKELFFDRNVQEFIGLLHEENFKKIALDLQGYALNHSGKMIYPKSELAS